MCVPENIQKASQVRGFIFGSSVTKGSLGTTLACKDLFLLQILEKIMDAFHKALSHKFYLRGYNCMHVCKITRSIFFLDSDHKRDLFSICPIDRL